MTIIIAGAGGLVLTIVIICICVTCRYRNKRKPKSEPHKQDSQKRNALEMAVTDSTNTAYQLAMQNSQGSYYSLPRPAGHATMMHRGSFSSKVPSEGDYGDHMSDSSTYKKFLALDQTMDDDSSRCPSPYSPSFTTIIEQHPHPPGMTPEWNYQNNPDLPALPSLAENLSKLQQYTQFNKSLQPLDASGRMTMDFRYDPSTPIYPATKFRIKSQDPKYIWNEQEGGKDQNNESLTIKNVDADMIAHKAREMEMMTHKAREMEMMALKAREMEMMTHKAREMDIKT